MALTNDANAAALGEMFYGGAKGMKDFIVITLGTGLGSGIVTNGSLVYGHDGFAGEIGHTIVEPGGRSCGCGRSGCLETYASATGIVRTAFELMSERSDPSSLREIPYSAMTAKDISEAALKGDALALMASRVHRENSWNEAGRRRGPYQSGRPYSSSEASSTRRPHYGAHKKIHG